MSCSRQNRRTARSVSGIGITRAERLRNLPYQTHLAPPRAAEFAVPDRLRSRQIRSSPHRATHKFWTASPMPAPARTSGLLGATVEGMEGRVALLKRIVRRAPRAVIRFLHGGVVLL